MKNQTPEVESLIELAKSWSEEDDSKAQEKLLLHSIALCDQYVSNYDDLAELYIKQGRIQEAIPMLAKAIENVQKTHGIEIDKNKDYDLTAIEPFIDTWLKQTYISESSLESMKEKLKDLKLTLI